MYSECWDSSVAALLQNDGLWNFAEVSSFPNQFRLHLVPTNRLEKEASLPFAKAEGLSLPLKKGDLGVSSKDFAVAPAKFN